MCYITYLGHQNSIEIKLGKREMHLSVISMNLVF